jgi:hypothetical protein
MSTGLHWEDSCVGAGVLTIKTNNKKEDNIYIL